MLRDLLMEQPEDKLNESLAIAEQSDDQKFIAQAGRVEELNEADYSDEELERIEDELRRHDEDPYQDWSKF